MSTVSINHLRFLVTWRAFMISDWWVCSNYWLWRGFGHCWLGFQLITLSQVQAWIMSPCHQFCDNILCYSRSYIHMEHCNTIPYNLTSYYGIWLMSYLWFYLCWRYNNMIKWVSEFAKIGIWWALRDVLMEVIVNLWFFMIMDSREQVWFTGFLILNYWKIGLLLLVSLMLVDEYLSSQRWFSVF